MTSTLSPSAPVSPALRLSTRAAQGVSLVLVIVLGVLLARAIWFAVYGAAALSLDIQAPTMGTDRGASAQTQLAGPALGLFSDRLAGDVQGADIAAPESRLNIILRGVRVGATPQDGSAIIAMDSGRQRIVRVGGEISDGIEVEAIYADRLLINRRGSRETLYLRDRERREARESIARAPEPQPETVLSLESIRSGLDLSPVISGNQASFEIGPAADPGWLSQFGLQSGDRLMAINDAPLSAPDQVQRALEQPGSPRITLEREGRQMVVTLPAALSAASQE